MKVDKLRNGGGRAFRAAERQGYVVPERDDAYDEPFDLAHPTADAARAGSAFAAFAPDAGERKRTADLMPAKKHWWSRR